MSLTSCIGHTYVGEDVMKVPQTHILSVIGKKYIEHFFRNVCNVTHVLSAIEGI